MSSDKNKKFVARVDSALEDLMELFFENRWEEIKAIEASLRNEDYKAIGSLAHQMKGVGGSYGFSFILMFEALKETSHLNTSTIYTTLPLLTLLLGGVLGDPIRLRQLGILALSMAATLWVIFRGDLNKMLALEFSRGDLIFFLGNISLAVYVLALKKLARDESKVCFTFYSLLVATIALLAASWWRLGTLPLPGAGVWLGLGYLAILSTAVTFWMLQLAAVRLGPNRVVAYTFLTPSAVVGIQWILGLSKIEWSILPGIGLTLLAVWLLQHERISGSMD